MLFEVIWGAVISERVPVSFDGINPIKAPVNGKRKKQKNVMNVVTLFSEITDVARHRLGIIRL